MAWPDKARLSKRSLIDMAWGTMCMAWGVRGVLCELIG